MIRFESGGEETPEVTIRILKSKNIYYLDQSIGWLYFVLWSVSFYPQVKNISSEPGHLRLNF